MSFLSILIIAIGLGMDAFSVAIGVGAGFRVVSAGAVFRLSSYFGLFQFIYLSKPLTLSVVGRGGGGPTPLAYQQC